MKNIKNKFIPLLISIFAAVTLGLSGCMDLFDKEDVPTSFTITFNGNGGKTASGETTYTQSYAYGETKALMANKFINSGYKIKGWDVNKDSTTAKYGDSSEQEFSADITLYAIWEKNGFSVEYDGGEAGSIDVPVDENIYESGDTVTIDSMVPVWSGYTFKGWKKSDDPSETLYPPSTSTFTSTFIINASVKLTAMWAENKIQGGGINTEINGVTKITVITNKTYILANGPYSTTNPVPFSCEAGYTYTYLCDGEPFKTTTNETFTWDTAEATSGENCITVIAVDSEGNVYSDAIYITVER